RPAAPAPRTMTSRSNSPRPPADPSRLFPAMARPRSCHGAAPAAPKLLDVRTDPIGLILPMPLAFQRENCNGDATDLPGPTFGRFHEGRRVDDPGDRRPLGLHPGAPRGRRLGRLWTDIPLLRGLAARHQHGHNDRDVPDGLPDPERPEPRVEGDPPKA